jgi:hypothetical protein
LGGDGSADALDAHDAQSANETAYSYVDEHGLLPPLGSCPESGNGTPNNNNARINEEAWGNDQMLHIVNVVDCGLYRRICSNNNGADDALEASDLSDEAETLFQEDGGEDGADDDGQGSEGSNQDCVCEEVCGKVADFAENHEGHSTPPPGIFEISIALARLFVVLCVRLQETSFLEHERGADEEPGSDGQNQANDFVRRRFDGGLGDGCGRVAGSGV